MITANISKTKNELSRYLDAVRRGETVTILDRKQPIAQIRPLPASGGGLFARVESLAASGLVSRGDVAAPDWVSALLVPDSGEETVGSVAALLEERDSGR